MTAKNRLVGPDEILVLGCSPNLDTASVKWVVDRLSRMDRTRFESIRAEATRKTFVAGRLLLIWLEWAIHGRVDSPALAFAAHGKPSFADDCGWCFNLSHTDKLAVLAATPEQAIGIDIESSMRRVDFQALSKRIFHPDEADWWKKGEESPIDFFRLWTLKEAWLKMRGEGITIQLQGVNVLPFLESENIDGCSATFPEMESESLVSVVRQGLILRSQTRMSSGKDLIEEMETED